MAERKNPELDAKHQAILRRMMQLPENKNCADCKGPYPRWASTNLGIFVCMTCSGIHRKLGTHISQVRSITLDTWTPSQVVHFQKLGNAKAAAYFEACLPGDFRRPHSSDSQRMELFIRDKYENRRFITVENGGLGGAPPGRPSAAAAANLSAPTKQPSRRATAQPYDDRRGSRPTSSNSYAARFSSGNAQAQPRPNSLGSARPSGPAAGADALKRAATLRELVNMGFPTNLALKAVQASRGDLQRAVEWLLENSAPQAGAGGGGVPTAQATPAAQAVQSGMPNLLDFGEAAPPKPAGSSAAPPANGKATAKPAAPPAHFSDFADFGDFESALPTSKTTTASGNPPASAVTAPAQSAAKPPPPASLGGSLAELYKRGPPKPASPSRNPVSRMPANTSTSPNAGALSLSTSGIRAKTASPLSGNKPYSPSTGSERAKLGMPTIELGRSDMQRAVNLGKSIVPPNNAPVQDVQATTPPPPPPMQQKAIISSSAPPPPTAPPPPDANNTGDTEQSHQTSATVSTEPKGDSVPEPEKNQEPKEDDDPFAALSMMALSTASKPKKEKLTEPAAIPPAKVEPAKAPAPAPSPAVAQPAGSFDLDEFFG